MLLSATLIQAAEANIYVGDFNIQTHRADVYLEDDSICNRTIQSMVEAMETTFPSHVITEQLNSKKAFQKSVSAWKAAHFATSPSQIANGGIDEKGYYTAIILSVFKAETTNDTYIWDNVKQVESNTNKMLSNMKKWVEEADQIHLDSISKNQILTTISVSEQSEIRAYLCKEFKKNHPVLNSSSTLASDIAEIFNAVDTLGEAVELMESYIQIEEMSDNMKAVLTEMNKQCPSDKSAMKSALQDAAQASECLSGALSATLSNTAGKETAEVFGVLLNEGWKSLIKGNPYARVFMTGAEVGTWLGDTVCSTLFSTNKTIEQYEKMKCLDEFSVLLKTVLNNMGKTYLQNPSTMNAENYFAAVDALFSTADLSCKFASDYGKILYQDTALGWLTISKANYTQYMSSVNSIRNIYEQQQSSLLNNYFAALECNYPDIYAVLTGSEDNEPVAVTGIQFDYDEMTIGMEDLIITGIKKPVISPSNASNQKITYTSSDSSILTVSSDSGWCTPKEAGTVTVTARSEDGDFTDSIRVRIVEGKSDAWDAVMTRVVTRGTYGDSSVSFVLYDDGKLVIDGEGEMGTRLVAASYDSYSVKTVVTEEGITSIGPYAFFSCIHLTALCIPESVTSIREYAFKNCVSLKSMNIPKSVTSIGKSAFSNCWSLKNLNIPESVTNIGEYAFVCCNDLKSLTIPSSVTSIGEYAFYDCKNLTNIYYCGNKEQWERGPGISGRVKLGISDSVTIHYNSLGSEDIDNGYNSGETSVQDANQPQQSGTSQKVDQTITAKNITKTYGAKAFFLGAKSTAGKPLIYTVSNKKVATVDKKGKVMIKGCGNTDITITAPETDAYNQAQLTIKLTVKPKKVLLSSVKSAKKKTVTVKWKRDKMASGYIIACATDSKFKKNKVQMTVKNNKTLSATVKKLKPGKKYYVKVCAYAKSGKTKVQGDWSKVKKINVKK